MNVSKIWWGYREIGPSYGLPVIFVKAGNTQHSPETLMEEMRKMGLNIKQLVVLTGFGTEDKGIATLVEGLKLCKVSVEFECGGLEKMPAWFTRVDRWFVEWLEEGLFNYTGLRTKQDMLTYKGTKIEKFLTETEGIGALRGLLVPNPEALFERVKGQNVRVYKC